MASKVTGYFLLIFRLLIKEFLPYFVHGHLLSCEQFKGGHSLPEKHAASAYSRTAAGFFCLSDQKRLLRIIYYVCNGQLRTKELCRNRNHILHRAHARAGCIDEDIALCDHLSQKFCIVKVFNIYFLYRRY